MNYLTREPNETVPECGEERPLKEAFLAPPPPVEVAELVWFYLDGVLYQRAQTRDFQNAVGGLA